MWVQSLASLSGLVIQHYGELWYRLQMWLNPKLLWLWHRPTAVALIPPQAWELPCAVGTALKKKQKKGRLISMSYCCPSTACSQKGVVVMGGTWQPRGFFSTILTWWFTTWRWIGDYVGVKKKENFWNENFPETGLSKSIFNKLMKDQWGENSGVYFLRTVASILFHMLLFSMFTSFGM